MTELKRTMIRFPKTLHDQLKIMSILTNTSMTNFVRIAVQDKIKQLKEQQQKLTN